MDSDRGFWPYRCVLCDVEDLWSVAQFRSAMNLSIKLREACWTPGACCGGVFHVLLLSWLHGSHPTPHSSIQRVYVRVYDIWSGWSTSETRERHARKARDRAQ